MQSLRDSIAPRSTLDRLRHRPETRLPLSWAMPFLVVLLGLATAKFVLVAPLYFIIAGSVAFVSAFVLCRNIQAGVLILIYIAALAFGESPGVQSPNSGYKAGLMPSQMLLGFLALLWIGRMAFADELRLPRNPLNKPLLALVAVAWISLLSSNAIQGTRTLRFHQLMITQVAEVGLLMFSVIAFMMTASVMRDRAWINRIYLPVLLLGLYAGVSQILNIPRPVEIKWATLLVTNAMALTYSRLLFANVSSRQRWFLAALLGVLLVASFWSLKWLSGTVAAAVVLFVVTIYRSRTAAGVIALLIILALFVYPGIYTGLQRESESGGDYDRFTIWHDATEMFMAVNPVFGVGPGNYHAYVYYHNTIWFGDRTYTTAHSNYMQIAAELGLVGMAVLCWVVIGGIATGMRAVRASPPDMKWLGVAATAVFASIACASAFGDYMFPSRGNNGIVNFGTTVYNWLIMGAAVAAAGLPSYQESGDPE